MTHRGPLNPLFFVYNNQFCGRVGVLQRSVYSRVVGC